MSLRLFSSPWGAFAGEDGAAVDGKSLDVACGAVFPRLVGPMPELGAWNGSRPVCASTGVHRSDDQWDVPYPVSGDQVRHTWRNGDRMTLVGVEGMRARVGEAERDQDQVEKWLVWQLQRYAELGDLTAGGESEDDLECRLPWGVRRKWSTVERLWSETGDEAAKLALVVRLAQDDRLIRALRSIERAPRRMLIRRHEWQKVSRIQEMDSSTLRAYSQAPGVTAVQKAGARQELQAVVRRDTVDLVENRLLLWVARRVRRMAEAYCRQNERFSRTRRFLLVRRLHHLCLLLLKSPRLAEAGQLPHHLLAPTYCLQFERRYRRVWLAYRLIRRQDTLVDDAWRWQAHFWGTTARVLVGSMLLGLSGWEERLHSTPYFSIQGACGEWMAGPSTPGPLDTPLGRCHVLDLRALPNRREGAGLGVPPEVRCSGADWVFLWPGTRKVLLLWAAVATGAVKADREGLGAVRLGDRIDKLNRETAWRWGAILFIGEPTAKASDPEILAASPGVVTIRVPADIAERWEDMKAGVELAVEELHRG